MTLHQMIDNVFCTLLNF